MTARIRAFLLTALTLAAFDPLLSQAQDSGAQRDDQQAQKDAGRVQSQAAQEGRANDRINNDPSLNNDQSRRQDDVHGAGDRATELHRTHAHAAARCHDGFFTTTRDRARACTRHGGIDAWLIG
jgi:hypothetical protein